MNNLISYTFKSTPIRTIIIADTPWFVATDVAQALEYRNAPDAIRTLDDDEKDTHIMRTLKGEQELSIINESGLYSLILRSRKPEAKAFKKFVTSEVLPAIRRQGYYGTPAIADNKDTMKAIGGIVKKCCAVAVRQELLNLLAGDPQADWECSDQDLIYHLYRWHNTKSKADTMEFRRLHAENNRLQAENTQLKNTLDAIRKAVRQ